MPKLTCLCGETINLSPVPNPRGFLVLWEMFIEPLVDELVKAHREAWTGLVRAGASLIISYGSRHAREWLAS